MPIVAPLHGTTADLGGTKYPLLIRHAEIERWEEKHGTGILKYVFGVFGQGGETSTSRQDKDFLILGLVGAGMAETDAEHLVEGLPVTSYVNEVVVACRDLVLRTFYDADVDQEDEPEEDDEADDDEKKSIGLVV